VTRSLDDLARAVLSCDVTAAQLKRALDDLADVMATLASVAGDPREQAVYNRARATLAEHGRQPGAEIAVQHAQAYAAWEQAKCPRCKRRHGKHGKCRP
jgi:hypothetical protein